MHRDVPRASQTWRQKTLSRRTFACGPSQCPLPARWLKVFAGCGRPWGSSGSSPVACRAPCPPASVHTSHASLCFSTQVHGASILSSPGPRARLLEGSFRVVHSNTACLHHLSSKPGRGSLLFTVFSSLSLPAPAAQGPHLVVSNAG